MFFVRFRAFLVNNCIFVAHLGAEGAQIAQNRPKSSGFGLDFVWILLVLGAILEICSMFFLMLFWKALWRVILAEIGAQRVPKGGFWEAILVTLWGQAENVKTVLPLKRELHFEGPRETQNGTFWHAFSEVPSRRSPEEDFCRFLAILEPNGRPLGAILMSFLGGIF